MMTMNHYQALLLIGPTGSGKTPLGDFLERTGLWGRRCLHFDFGANLRRVAEGGIRAEAFAEDELAVVRESLAKGVLLEQEHFPIVEKILRDFAESNGLDDKHWLVLNGMPRHVGQAVDLERTVDVKAVIVLDCDEAVVHRRIHSNSGGDRHGRIDDSAEAITRRLALFDERTRPLLDHYRVKRVRIEAVKVSVGTKPADIVKTLEGVGSSFSG